MIVAVASGKGGTGKTTLAVNLAASLGEGVRLFDCDVEEPNCHLFLRPRITHSRAACILVPAIDRQKCTACGKCAEICQFNAISFMKGYPLVFEELCHGCGGCARICPGKAIDERQHAIGTIEFGRSNRIEVVTGRLHVGERLVPQLIQDIKRQIRPGDLTIVDCPPGTSCPMVAALHGADSAILVTEPTPFGLHDLSLAVEAVRRMGLPFGVVINRVGIGDDRVHEYCREQDIPILLEIPDDRRIAEAYSTGKLIVEALPEYREVFRGLAEKILNGCFP